MDKDKTKEEMIRELRETALRLDMYTDSSQYSETVEEFLETVNGVHTGAIPEREARRIREHYKKARELSDTLGFKEELFDEYLIDKTHMN